MAVDPVELPCPGCGSPIEMRVRTRNRGIGRFEPGTWNYHRCPARNVSRTHDRHPDGYAKPTRTILTPRPKAWKELDSD